MAMAAAIPHSGGAAARAEYIASGSVFKGEVGVYVEMNAIHAAEDGYQ